MYKQSDDGKEIDGHIVVWLQVPRANTGGTDAAGTDAKDKAKGDTAEEGQDEAKKAPPPAEQEAAPAALEKEKPEAEAPPEAPAARDDAPTPEPAPERPKRGPPQEEKLVLATAAAKALQAAAKNGVPFCAECAAAKRKLQASRR